MKHRVQGKKLNRDSQSRRALFKNLLRSLIEYHHLTTTLPKAKAIQGQFDSLVVKAKKNTIASIREIDKIINDRHLVNLLVKEIAPAVGSRQSGFTRIIRLKKNQGDNATLVRLELVDLPQVKTPEVKAKKASKTKAPTKKPAVKVKEPQIEPQESLKIKAPTTVAAAPETMRKTP